MCFRVAAFSGWLRVTTRSAERDESAGVHAAVFASCPSRACLCVRHAVKARPVACNAAVFFLPTRNLMPESWLPLSVEKQRNEKKKIQTNSSRRLQGLLGNIG